MQSVPFGLEVTLPQREAVQFLKRVMILEMVKGVENFAYTVQKRSVAGCERNQRPGSCHSPEESAGR